MASSWRRWIPILFVGVALPWTPGESRGGPPPIDPRILPGSEAAGPAPESSQPVLPREARALWVVRDALLSPAGIDRMVQEAQRAGTTDLLVQVRGRGDAYYRSRVVPTAPPLRGAWRRHGDFDPLDRVIGRAREAGIRVHAWINVYYVDGGGRLPEDHVLFRRPDWAAADAGGTPMTEMSRARLRRGETEGVFLDPGRPEVVAHLLRVVDEIVSRYPVDGIHLDYVRYPGVDVGYGYGMRREFYRRTGVDPARLGRDPALLRERKPAELLDLERRWRGLRADQVTTLVAGVSRTARARRPWILVSAAVKPDPDDARLRWGQDWKGWLREGLVDFVAPMMYSTSTETVARQARILAETVPVDRIWAGIAVYNQTVDAAEEKIDRCRRAGIRGVSIFSYNSLPDPEESLPRLHRVR